MNNSSAPGGVTDATPGNEIGASGRAGEEGDGNGTSHPPRGVFQALGVMELEHPWNGRRTTDPFVSDAPSHGEHDDDSSVDTDGGDAFFDDTEDEFRGDDAGGGFFDSWNAGVEFLPTFGGREKPTNHETRAINQEIEDLNLTGAGNDTARPNARGKKYFVALGLLICVGILSAVVFATGTNEDDLPSPKAAASSAIEDETAAPTPAHQGPMKSGNYHATPHETEKPSKANARKPTKKPTKKPSKQPTPKPSMLSVLNNKPASTSKELDLSIYGYPHSQDTAVGWVTWPPEMDDETSLSTFDVEDGITSVEQCAAKCQDAKAPTGAWDVKHKSCWCSFVDVAHLCREACVEEEYVDFSTVPISDLGYCEKSVCDEEWYHSEEYCVDEHRFDGDACDAKIEALTALPHIIKPSAMTTIKKSKPDAKTGGVIHFSVEGDERISFVRFELPTLSGGEEVTDATLNLYLVSHHEEPIVVSIEALPHGGVWSDSSVCWNDQVESRGLMFVDSFEAKGLESGDRKHLYTRDVTSAINSKSKRMTFKLSTDSSIRKDFAGKEWNDGTAVPELVLTMSA